LYFIVQEPSGIEAGVDAEVARRELREVAQDLGLGELRQARRLGAASSAGRRRREVGLRQLAAAAPGCDFSKISFIACPEPSASDRCPAVSPLSDRDEQRVVEPS
jgi:hypothetical protein